MSTNLNYKPKDLTPAQFREACARHQITLDEGPLGYCALGPGTTIRVSRLNAGVNRRAQLAFLLREQEKDRKRHAIEQAAFERMQALAPSADPETRGWSVHGHAGKAKVLPVVLEPEQAAEVVLLIRKLRGDK